MVYWTCVHHPCSQHKHLEAHRRGHFQRGFTDEPWSLNGAFDGYCPTLSVRDKYSLQMTHLCQLCRWHKDMCCTHYEGSVSQMLNVLPGSARTPNVCQKKIEYLPSLLGMVQSRLTNGPAVCGESAVGAVEEWLWVSKNKHPHTSKSVNKEVRMSWILDKKPGG